MEVRDIAKFTVSPQVEEQILGPAAFQRRNLRKAPPKVWRRTEESAPDGYVRPRAPLTQSGVVVDGDGDLKRANGVRLAYIEQHRGSGGFVQHGRIRNVGGNLVLMPLTQPKGDDDKSADDLLAQAKRQLAELEVMQRRLAYMKEHKGE